MLAPVLLTCGALLEDAFQPYGCFLSDSLLCLETKLIDYLQEEVPDLLEILQQKGLAEHVDLLDLCNPSAPDNVYSEMHSILSRLCEGKMGSWQGRNVTGACLALLSCCWFSGWHHGYCVHCLWLS